MEGGWSYRHLLAFGIVEVLDSLDPSVYQPFVANFCMNFSWERLRFESSSRPVAIAKLNYEGIFPSSFKTHHLVLSRS